MAKSTFPLIFITDDGQIDLVQDENSFFKVAASAVPDAAYFTGKHLFDGNKQRWSYQQIPESFKINWLIRVLARTFYNPLPDAKVIWTSKGTYTPDDLKERIFDCIDKDDDVITPFEEAGVIKSAIQEAGNFDDILKVLRKYIFAVNEEERWKEQAARNK